MTRVSAFISDKALGHYKRELHFYIVFALVLALCGLMLLLLPIKNRGDVVGFLVSWLLFIAVVLSLLRTALFGRGLPDFVAGFISAFFYGFVGYLAGGYNLMNIEGYRLAICAVLLFTGLSRLLVFARMLSVATMPMQLVCCLANMLSAALLFWGWPGSSASVIYWYTGMLMLIDAAEQVAEAGALSRHAERKAVAG
jgi:hypothetical protein